MKKTIILLFLLSSTFPSVINANDFNSIAVKPDQWIKSWLLVGPFTLNETESYSTDFLESKGGEEKPVLKEGDMIDFGNGNANVISHNSPDSLIRFNIKKQVANLQIKWLMVNVNG